VADTVATFQSRIVPELADKARPLTDAQPHPDNARKHKIDRIKRSLLDHGQRTVIVVQRSTGFVVKGNGTWEAARQLGWEEIAQDWQEMDDEQAYAYLLADNKASDASEYDVKKLRGALEKMVAGPGLDTTLWDVDELEDLIAQDEAPIVEAEFKGSFAESEENRAARIAASQTAEPGQKRREIPLVFTAADHALFVGWLKTLQKRWSISGTMATVYAAVKRQAEAEEGAVRVGAPITQEASAQERQHALGEFRDLITTLGLAREYKGGWLVEQLNLQIGQLVAPAVVEQAAPTTEDLPEGEDPMLPSHLENLPMFPDEEPPTPEAAAEAAVNAQFAADLEAAMAGQSDTVAATEPDIPGAAETLGISEAQVSDLMEAGVLVPVAPLDAAPDVGPEPEWLAEAPVPEDLA
jgi:hypothetical protein